jgi:hypothetical protein
LHRCQEVLFRKAAPLKQKTAVAKVAAMIMEPISWGSPARTR